MTDNGQLRERVAAWRASRRATVGCLASRSRWASATSAFGLLHREYRFNAIRVQLIREEAYAIVRYLFRLRHLSRIGVAQGQAAIIFQEQLPAASHSAALASKARDLPG